MEKQTKPCWVKWCDEPTKHAMYRPNGELTFWCVKHFDEVIGKLRNYDPKDSRIIEVRKLNPGLL